jgi:hypothetical protein
VLLRLAAMLVSHVVASTRMLLTRLPRECHTDVERDRLPAMELGNRKKEAPAAAHSQTQTARKLIVLPLIPAKAGTQGSPRSLFQREAAARNPGKPPGLSWIPAFAGTSGTLNGKPRP